MIAQSPARLHDSGAEATWKLKGDSNYSLLRFVDTVLLVDAEVLYANWVFLQSYSGHWSAGSESRAGMYDIQKRYKLCTQTHGSIFSRWS